MSTELVRLDATFGAAVTTSNFLNTDSNGDSSILYFYV